MTQASRQVMIEMVALVISRLKDVSPEALPPATSRMEIPASNGMRLHHFLPLLYCSRIDLLSSWQRVCQCRTKALRVLALINMQKIWVHKGIAEAVR